MVPRGQFDRRKQNHMNDGQWNTVEKVVEKAWAKMLAKYCKGKA